MNPSLKNFRDEFLETLLRFLWRDWTALGVAGHESVGRRVVDPEALLLFTCSMGRYDPRLFDEVLDWLTRNGRFVNVQRIKNMIRQESFGGGQVLSVVAHWLSQQHGTAKWKSLAENGSLGNVEALFYLSDGRPIPVANSHDESFLKYGFHRSPVVIRGRSRVFAEDSASAIFLRMRALMGVSVRADVLTFLTMAPGGHPRELARELYYSQKAVHDVMTDLEASGYVLSVRQGRERRFRLSPEALAFLTRGADMPPWVNWAVLLAAAESVWRIVDESVAAGLDFTTESHELLRVRPILERILGTDWSPPIRMPSMGKNLELLSGFRGAFEKLAA